MDEGEVVFVNCLSEQCWLCNEAGPGEIASA